MKLFITGGPGFMSILTLLLVIATAWIIYHFVVGYNSKQPNQEKILRKLGYGKSIGLFALVTGFLGQMIGLINAFSVISDHPDIKTEYIFDGIYSTMICPIYGMLIFLFSLLLWFVASFMIEKRAKNLSQLA